MRLTIIVPDNMVGIDGVFYEVALDGMVPDHLHALQWSGDYGEEEYLEDGVPRNARIEALDAYQGVIAKWQAARAGQPETEPELEPGPQHKTVFSVLEFRDRFSLDEAISIRQAQFDDMEVGLVYDAFHAAQFIDLDDPRVEQGLALYVAKGLLSEERKAELLSPELTSPP